MYDKQWITIATSMSATAIIVLFFSHLLFWAPYDSGPSFFPQTDQLASPIIMSIFVSFMIGLVGVLQFRWTTTISLSLWIVVFLLSLLDVVLVLPLPVEGSDIILWGMISLAGFLPIMTLIERERTTIEIRP